MSEATNAKKHYETWPESVKGIKSNAADAATGFGTLFQKTMSDGELSAMQKELIALGIGMAIRCEACIYSHAEKCLKAGATREQILEVGGVVMMMQGGPGFVYMPKLIEALDALGA